MHLSFVFRYFGNRCRLGSVRGRTSAGGTRSGARIWDLRLGSRSGFRGTVKREQRRGAAASPCNQERANECASKRASIWVSLLNEGLAVRRDLEGSLWLVFSEELFPVLDEADQHDNRRSSETEKKHDFHDSHCKGDQNHTVDSTLRRCFTLGAVCTRRNRQHYLSGSCGPPPGFPRSCSSCRFRLRGRCHPGDPSLHGLPWSRCFGRSTRPRAAIAGIHCAEHS